MEPNSAPMELARRSPAFSVDEFSQLVSATFDGIGHSDLDLLPTRASNNADPLASPTIDEPPRTPTVSLFRKVKSRVHDVVTRQPHPATHGALPTTFSEKHSVVSIAPSSPISLRSRARAKSLPRAFFHVHPPSPPDRDALPPVPPIPHSFFEDDSDSDISAHATLAIQPPPATPSRGSGAFRRLSSLFDSPPRILHPDAHSERVHSPTPLHKSTSVPLLNVAENTVAHQGENQSNAEQPSRPSFTAKLRTLRLSRSKYNLFNSNSAPAPLSAPPTVLTSEPTPVPPHPYAQAYVHAYNPSSPAQSTPSLSFSPATTPVTPFFNDNTHDHHQSMAGSHLAPPFDSQSTKPSDRPITPEDDPFRKAALTTAQAARPKKIHKSRSTPGLENRPSTDSSASSKSLSGSPLRGGVDSVSRGSRTVSKPSQLRPLHITSLSSVSPLKYQSATCASPLSFTFPLPPSDQDIGGVTVTVSTPPPFPPPAFPPPMAPPPNAPLPKVPSQEHRRRKSKHKPLPSVPGPAKALHEQLRAGIRHKDGRKDPFYRTKSRRRSVVVTSSSPDETILPRPEGRVRSGSPFPLTLDLNAAASRVDEKVGRRSELAIEEALDGMLLDCGSANLTMDGFEAQDAGVRFTNPWAPSDAAFDGDVRPDSEVEPEWVIEALSDTTDARKASVASTTSTSTARSDTSTATASSMTSVSGESDVSHATRDTVMPSLHPEARHLETVEIVKKQRIAYTMRHHLAEEDHGDADDESGSVEDSVWSMASSPGSFPGVLADWAQSRCEQRPWMPGSYASPEVNSSPSFTWSALGLENMVPQSMRAPSSLSNRLSDLWLNIPAPMFPTPQSHPTSVLGLQGVPPLPVSSADEFELEAAGRSEWFE